MNFDWQRCSRTSREDAVRTISVEFPKVPPRIIADVLSAYCTRSKSITDATRATRDRLRDACAV